MCKCPRCWSCCSSLATAIVVLFFALWLPTFIPGPTKADFEATSAAAKLEKIRRVNASELTPEAFFEEHVLKGVPVFIRLEEGSTGVWPVDSLLPQMLQSTCSKNWQTAISDIQSTYVDELLSPGLDWKTRLLADLIIWLFSGTTVSGWAEKRNITLQSFSEGVASARLAATPLGIRILEALTRVHDSQVLKGIEALAKLVASPVYLADKGPEEVCGDVLGQLNDTIKTSYERYAEERLKQPYGDWYDLTQLEFAGIVSRPDLRVFFGGPGSYSYPLHRDLIDGDVVCTQYSGCKDVVILRSESRKFMPRLSAPGLEGLSQMTWAHDPYSDAPLPGVRGWSGTMEPGDLMYMPAESIHHIRNSCSQSLTLCRRPWRASFARDIMLETMKTLRLTPEGDNYGVEAGIEDLKRRHGRF
eukprot:TRINITY_DN31618_c0_g1_i1.p1 TRINITY_DN31618_c0_g1~~TRINITY_DN31618_c0_g1_i1.p1  ORF type:complete len:416 (+),score=28.85 TRINITY_DN31618_c0_g1_i1:213-1460(+)